MLQKVWFPLTGEQPVEGTVRMQLRPPVLTWISGDSSVLFSDSSLAYSYVNLVLSL